MDTLTLLLERLPTALGEMLILTDEQGRLRALDWEDYEARMHELLRHHYGAKGYAIRPHATGTPVCRVMERYLAGELHAIDQVEVATGGTLFQREVWAALRQIPAGKTLSYGVLAAQIGRPKAMRAVGLANGANPVSIVVPCHRVIGANATLTGYGGGLHRKHWLLMHEGVMLPLHPRKD